MNRDKIKFWFAFFLFIIFVFSFDNAMAICCKCESAVSTSDEKTIQCENVNINACEELNSSGGAPGVSFQKKCTLIDCSDPLCPVAEVEPTPIRQEIKETVPILNIKIGNTLIQFDPVKCAPGEVCPISWLAQYINVLFQYLIGIAAIISSVVILFGGFVWLTSFGSQQKVKQAKEYITGAFMGLLLALFSYLILFTINPNLVNFNPINLKVVVPSEAQGFGLGAKNEGQRGSDSQNAQTGTNNDPATGNTNLTDYALEKIKFYESQGCTKTSGWRADGDGSRHQSGYVADFALSEPCITYIKQNAVKTVGASKWWNAYYIMPDGSVWVDENNAVTGGSGPHFHTEFPDGINWQWREAI